MCERASLQDAEIRQLCNTILSGQQSEIDQMKAILNRLERANSGCPSPNVRFGSLADKPTSPCHVPFTPNNGRWAAHPSQHLAVGL